MYIKIPHDLPMQFIRFIIITISRFNMSGIRPCFPPPLPWYRGNPFGIYGITLGFSGNQNLEYNCITQIILVQRNNMLINFDPRKEIISLIYTVSIGNEFGCELCKMSDLNGSKSVAYVCSSV